MLFCFAAYCQAVVSPWQDHTQPVAARVESLISLLTLEEKASLLGASSPAVSRLGLPPYRWARECERGDVSGPAGTAYPTGLALGASFDPKMLHEVAAATAIEVRGNINAAAEPGAPLSGASCFGPVSNLVRDSRWGRTAEMVTGEDPLLGRVMSRAFTWGMMMPPSQPPAAAAAAAARSGGSPPYPRRMLVTIAKHLNTYAGPEGWGYTFGPHAARFNFEARLTEREWREFFLPSYLGAAEAGVAGFMCSYTAVTFTDNTTRQQNTPACASELLLTDTVRRGWNWTGYVLSDAGATAFVANTTLSPGTSWEQECPNCTFGHGWAANASDAAARALRAGLDVELTCCGAPAVFPTLPATVRQGRLAEARLDDALRHTLPFRFELGQLDGLPNSGDTPPPSAYAALGAANVTTPAMAALALRAAKRSIVLLKNAAPRGAAAPLLPLSTAAVAGRTVCVVGPNANNTRNMLGGYVNAHNPGAVGADDTTVLGGIRREFVAAGATRVLHAPGCGNTSCLALDIATVALLASDACELLVLALGLTADARAPSPPEGGANACGCRHDDAVEGECCDRASDALPGQQLALLQLAGAAAAPTVLLSVSAGQLDLGWAAAAGSGVDAILNLIYPGQAAGRAVAQLLLGLGPDGNPAARLPITYYDDMDAAGSLTDYGMHGRTYRYSAAKVRWPFGFGLSYTTFAYGEPRWAMLPGGRAGRAWRAARQGAAPAVHGCDALRLTVPLRNAGTRGGDEVVQLYLSLPRNASVPVASRQLSSFARVHLAAGEARDVTFTIVPEDHAVMRAGHGGDFALVLEPGARGVWVGGASDPATLPGAHATFSVVSAMAPLASCARGRAKQWWDGSGTDDAARWAPAAALQRAS